MRRFSIPSVVPFLLALCLHGPAGAEEAALPLPPLVPAQGDGPARPSAPGKVFLGLQTGVMLPQVASELGTAAGLRMEGGYRVWHSLAVTGGLGYAAPGVRTSGADPRLGAEYASETSQRMLTVSVGALWWFLPRESRLNAWAGAGTRMYLLETITNGSAGGEPFRENRETSTRFGAVIHGGVQYGLGPGALTADLEFAGSALPHLITGQVTTSALSLLVGYRLFI